MQIVDFEPGNGTRYQIAVTPLDGHPGRIMFFGRVGEDQPLLGAEMPLIGWNFDIDDEPDYTYFLEKFQRAGLEFGPDSLMIYMALRYVLGLSVVLSEIPSYIAHQMNGDRRNFNMGKKVIGNLRKQHPYTDLRPLCAVIVEMQK